MQDSEFKNIIELRNIEQTYNNGQTVILQDLNLLIEDKPAQGEFAVILGPSGCGKSTVLRYIAGLQMPTAGEVLIHDQPKSEKDRISMVFQQYSSLPWMTVLENVALALKYQGVDEKERNEKAMEFIQMVGLDGHEHKFAQYPKLSGGQMQRVAIARSLISNPDIILMDEPFGALDVNTRLQMQDLLADIWTRFNSTIIFVTHDIPEAVYLADDIYIMKKAPSKFVKQINVDLPLERSRELKREKHFTDLVQFVEDQLVDAARS